MNFIVMTKSIDYNKELEDLSQNSQIVNMYIKSDSDDLCGGG